MNILETIATRRSVKAYDPAHLMPEADLEQLLQLGRLAPWSFNGVNRFLPHA